MPSGRGDLERALGDFLALDLGEVGAALRGLGLGLRGRGQDRAALQMGEQGEEVGRGDDFELTRPRRFGPLRGGADQPLVRRRGVNRREQHARRRRDPPVEAQFADRDIMRQRFGIGGADRGQHAQSDRQIEVRAFLGQIGGRQVAGDALGRQCKPDRGERRAHPLAAFGDRLVGEADDDERRQARRQLDLDLDRTGFEPEIGDGGDGGGHLGPPLMNWRQTPP